MARQRSRCDRGASVDAGAFEPQFLARRQAGDLQDQRRRTVGIFLRSLREILKRNQRRRLGDNSEMRVGRRVGERRAETAATKVDFFTMVRGED